MFNIALVGVFLVGVLKSTYFFIDQNYASGIFWVLGSIWITWLIYALRYNKDLPSVGPFDYKKGANQLARGIYIVAMTSLFFVVAII
jgi:hypothetical protein